MTDVNSRMMSSAQCTQTGAQVPRAHARRVMCSNQMYTRSRARQPFRAATSAGLSHSACTAAASARSSPAAEGCLPSHSPHPARQIISRSSAKRRSWSQPAGGRRPVAASAGASGIEETDVVIIGGGLAGLGAALALQKAGIPFLLLEASDGVGGRVRTDAEAGFLLDRGFQIFLTSYPECKEVLDYEALQLQPFYAGATIRFSGGWHRVADPLRHLADALGSLANPIGSPIDKVRVGLFRLKSLAGGTYDALSAPETSTMKQLQAEGFSAAMVDRFFRPFLGGIFFDNALGTSSRLTSFVMRMLATGSNCLPAQGIGAVTQQLAARLPDNAVRLESPVETLDTSSGNGGVVVKTKAGATVRGRRGVIVAADGPAAALLLGPRLQGSSAGAVEGVGTCNLYFSADQPPSEEPMLYLNGDGCGIVNNVCFPSTVAPSYAPPGKTLVSVSTVGTHPDVSEEQLAETVKLELGSWWSAAEVGAWAHLRTYRIPFAQPMQAPPTNLRKEVSLGDGVYVCGDHRDTATFDGALLSGRRAAEVLLAES